MNTSLASYDFTLPSYIQNLHHLLTDRAGDDQTVAIVHGVNEYRYHELSQAVQRVAAALKGTIDTGDRVAVYLPKCFESVVACFAISAAGGVFVPINPVLKPAQVEHILRDSGAKVLISQCARFKQLAAQTIDMSGIYCYSTAQEPRFSSALAWPVTEAVELFSPVSQSRHALAALLYTSGSTGLPKGVMLSHENLLLGLSSVTAYLGITAEDVVLAALPLSFDYGLNQLLCSIGVGAKCVLLDYILPNDVLKACAAHRVTALAGVPPLWSQLALLPWPQAAQQSLRYMTNSGGHLTESLIQQLQHALPNTAIVPMYGLTEAFRSSYLPPQCLTEKRGSMGRAIPYADLYVLNEHGQRCKPYEEGELVHAGPLVAQGYWQRPEQTAARFKPLPAVLNPLQPPAVWSGDRVYEDEEGFLYFAGRKDNQLKVSGYRISPEEIESVLGQCIGVTQAVAFGVPDPALGQALVVVVESSGSALTEMDVIKFCRVQLPAYMLPKYVVIQAQLPRNANGKLDRVALINTVVESL